MAMRRICLRKLTKFAYIINLRKRVDVCLSGIVTGETIDNKMLSLNIGNEPFWLALKVKEHPADAHIRVNFKDNPFAIAFEIQYVRHNNTTNMS